MSNDNHLCTDHRNTSQQISFRYLIVMPQVKYRDVFDPDLLAGLPSGGREGGGG